MSLSQKLHVWFSEVNEHEVKSGVSVVKYFVDACYMISCVGLCVCMGGGGFNQSKRGHSPEAVSPLQWKPHPLSLSLSLLKIIKFLKLKIHSCQQTKRLLPSFDSDVCRLSAPSFPEKMSPIKALTMKDYENVSWIYWRFLNCCCD